MKDVRELIDLHRKTPHFNIRNIIETLAVIDGKKPVMRLVVDDAAYDLIVPCLESFDLKIARSDFRQKPAFTTNLGDTYTELTESNDPKGGDFSLMVALDSNLASHAMRIEDYQEDPGALGKILGYPDCCTVSYERINEDTDWLMVFLSNTPFQKTYSYRANRIAYLFDEKSLFFDYFPCSLTCKKTAEITSIISLMLRKYGMNDFLEDVTEAMKVPVLISDGVITQIKKSHYNKSSDTITFDFSKSRFYGWKVETNADDSFIWESNKIKRNNDILEFYRDSTRLGIMEQTEYERLLIFR